MILFAIRLGSWQSQDASNNCQHSCRVYILFVLYVLSRLLISETKAVWVSVEYRLAPKHKYPIWLDDACGVAQHIIDNKISYGLFFFTILRSIFVVHSGINQTAKIGVAGDSAGAQISASVCRTVKNIDFQV
jgi:acetyl esterase/lipase